MPVSLLSIRKTMIQGVSIAVRSGERLCLDAIPDHLGLVRDLVRIGIAKTIGDLLKLPGRIELSDGTVCEKKLVFAGREYPQGWGRGPGGAAAELPPEPDGKVDTFREERNSRRIELDAQVSEFLDHACNPGNILDGGHR